jgi:hypothetical protein
MHLDDLGSSKDDVQVVELSAVEQALVDLAVLFKETAENELSVRNAIDSGKLADSIQFTDVVFMGGVYTVDIKVLDYYKFVNSGVKGTQNKSINSPFSFKNNRVSKDFMTAIRKWVIRHGMKSSSKAVRAKGGKYALGTERKTAKFKDSSNALAYAIATGIKKKGLKPTGFWDKAAEAVDKALPWFGDAFAIDIINGITNKK